ncbi:hypothetical protein [Burkholderia multivorans]|uniref:hypothetical protein n=1 Tax=Burkholderia multivorans TaxID=87883 RepID=UPI0021C18E49|nr:hypothetical protein [Burkholderia multivorans]
MAKRTVSADARASLDRQLIFADSAPDYHKRVIAKTLAKLLAEHAIPDDEIGLIRRFVDCIFAGALPPTDVLVDVAEKFSVYLERAGDLTLDQAFSLQSKQRIGHPLKNLAKKQQRAQIIYFMAMKRLSAEVQGVELSIEKAASEVINEFGLDESEDTLTKAYSQAKPEEPLREAFSTIQSVQDDLQRKK